MTETLMTPFGPARDQAQDEWDSESRSSAYATVSDPYTDDDYCEACDQTVDYTDGSKHGRCGCEA